MVPLYDPRGNSKVAIDPISIVPPRAYVREYLTDKSVGRYIVKFCTSEEVFLTEHFKKKILLRSQKLNGEELMV